MKKLFIFLITILACTSIMTACGSDKEKSDDSGESSSSETETNNKGKEDEGEDSSSEDNAVDKDDENNGDSGSNESELNIEEKDQLDLGVGDTGKFDTINGKYEITLDKVEIIKDELDGESSQMDDLILLDLTINNTGTEALSFEDLLRNLEITDDLGTAGSSDGAEYFDSVEKLSGDLEAGEEIEGQYITDIKETDEYYLQFRPGYVDSGKANEVIFTIKADEAE